MNISSTMKVKPCDNAIWRVIDGEVVVLLPDGGMLHALTGCGSRVWELIKEGMTIPEIVEKICDEYEVELERARDDVDEFINKLAELKLVEIVPAES